jgi:hypothetical protein
VPKLLRRERLHEFVVTAITRALLLFAEERGLIRSAEDTWSEIIERAPSADPKSEVSVMRSMRAL